MVPSISRAALAALIVVRLAATLDARDPSDTLIMGSGGGGPGGTVTIDAILDIAGPGGPV